MNRTKVLLSLIIIVVLVLALGGCSDQGNKEAPLEEGGEEELKDKEDTSSSSQEDNEKNSSEVVETLTVFSGAGLRKPMDEIGQVFEEKYGIKIEYSYAGSAQNLSQIELLQEGDLYIPGAAYYIEQAIEKGFVSESKEVVYHVPVIGVPKGNPANILGLDDLTTEGVKVVLGDERSAAIGKVAQKILNQKGILEEVEENVVSKDATVNEVMVHIAMEQADACIIWEDNVANVDEVEIIQIDEEFNDIKIIPIGILTFTKKEEKAKMYLDFVSSKEGREIFAKHGFRTIE